MLLNPRKCYLNNLRKCKYVTNQIQDIEFNRYVWPICLPDGLEPPNDGTYDRLCTVAGWGDTRCEFKAIWPISYERLLYYIFLVLSEISQMI